MHHHVQPSSKTGPATRARRGQSRRRQFSPEYKLQILEVVDQSQPDDVKALLEREELSSSHVTAWRRQRKLGTLPPPPPAVADSDPALAAGKDQQIAELRAEVTELQREVARLKPLENLHRQLAEVLQNAAS